MHDRIAAVGGTLTVYSTPSHGTRLHGSVPDPWPGATAGRRPPAIEPPRPPIPAASRQNPGPRHKATSAAAAKQHLRNQKAGSGNSDAKKRSSRSPTQRHHADQPIDVIAADGSRPSAQDRANTLRSLLLSPTRSRRAERARAR